MSNSSLNRRCFLATCSRDQSCRESITAEALFNAVQRALEVYKDKAAWRKLQRNGMAEDHSWAASAREYEKLYRKITALKAA